MTVSTLTDESDASCSDGDCSLRDAIAVAASGDDIVFSASILPGTITLDPGEGALFPTTNINILGPGKEELTISGNLLTRIFDISNGYTINISGVTISSGRVVDSNGACFYISNSTVNIDSSTITNCRADKSSGVGFGGAFFTLGNLTITNSTISNNTSDYGGAGIYNYFDANLILTDVVLSDNSNSNINATGGGAFIREGGSAILTRVTVSGNSSPYSGGGIGADGTLTIQDSTLNDNTTDGEGSAIYLYHGQVANHPTFTFKNITVTNNQGSGEAISSGLDANDSASLNNVTISGNTASGVNALAGIYCSQNCTIGNSIIANNIASNSSLNPDCSGTFISADYNLIESTLSGCSFSGTTTNHITGSDPQLAALSDNGGPTRTLALLASSPAIDAANNATCEDQDQRGAQRSLDGNADNSAICDIGAYEVPESSQITSAITSPNPSEINTPVTLSVAVAGAGKAASGTVAVSNTEDSCSITLNDGSGNCNLSFPSGGNKTLNLNFEGSLSHLPSAGSAQHTVNSLLTLNSQAANDGWLQESEETSSKADSKNSAAKIIKVGDSEFNQQYRGILSFDTSVLPDNANILSASLVLTLKKTSGKNPFKALKSLFVDLQSGNFATQATLQTKDFKSAATLPKAFEIANNPVNKVFTTELPTTAFSSINASGLTQLRLRFKKDDDNDSTADYLNFFSGNADQAKQPQLIIKYN